MDLYSFIGKNLGWVPWDFFNKNLKVLILQFSNIHFTEEIDACSQKGMNQDYPLSKRKVCTGTAMIQGAFILIMHTNCQL